MYYILTGDIAGLSSSQSEGHHETIASGIVSKVTPSCISVAFEESLESLNVDDQTQYKLLKLANDVTYRRLKRCWSKVNYIFSMTTLCKLTKYMMDNWIYM